MDESLQQLEVELKALRPRRARAEWIARISREMAAELPAAARPCYPATIKPGAWKWLGWRTAALAAALALVATVALLKRPRAQAAPTPVATLAPAPATGATAYQPMAATNVLYDVRDEGPVQTADGTTVRQVRARYVDTYTWKHPASNASIRMTVPRDEIRVLPASYNPN